jgi:hypothetical protein
MIAEIFAILQLIETVAEHADLVVGLARQIHDALMVHDSRITHEAQLGQMAGMAAYRANVIQEYERRKAKHVP